MTKLPAAQIWLPTVPSVGVIRKKEKMLATIVSASHSFLKLPPGNWRVGIEGKGTRIHALDYGSHSFTCMRKFSSRQVDMQACRGERKGPNDTDNYRCNAITGTAY
ncbi:hypothetical protein TWF225_012106 [Orbilia oligospora]|nr:hypothetical protein TWF225_012106 [Orbilia oligospora]KAF3248218.1 hypothetical protein TWF217_012090 [Orbilia oligospora]KAF3250402.1 hypothetical protein TWF128_012096 [Orbilia oligospora]KAF3285052.1 hypothetical protein TWF132_012110 [Orbilia oligospora]